MGCVGIEPRASTISITFNDNDTTFWGLAQPRRSPNPPWQKSSCSFHTVYNFIHVNSNRKIRHTELKEGRSRTSKQHCRNQIQNKYDLLLVPNLIQSVLLETYGTSDTLSGCRAPSREGRILLKFGVHLQAFVSQQAAFGEQLRGDTLQDSQPFRHFHL